MSDVETLQRIFVDALENEGFDRYGNRRAVYDVSQGCENPISVTKWSRATGRFARLVVDQDDNVRLARPIPVIEINFKTPCRRCRECLRRKSRYWRARCITEIEHSERTWFGTLTTSPEQDFRVDLIASTRCANFESQPPARQFGERSKVLGAEATKWLKRIRKESGHQFRYLLVTEVHDSERTSAEKRGRPHLHVALHENAGQPLRKAMLERQWTWGNSHFRLTKGDEAAWYISKYISKASDARTRASLGYGSPE